MTSFENSRHGVVFGASGLVGRHLVLALAAAGADVTVAVRTAESGARVERWARDRGSTRRISTVIVDFDAPEIVAGGTAAFAHVTEIHNCAGSYRFGMIPGEARGANVGIVEKLIEFAAGLPHLQRVVHVSGYRVGGQDPTTVPCRTSTAPPSTRSSAPTKRQRWNPTRSSRPGPWSGASPGASSTRPA